VVLVSKKFWDKLSPVEQKILSDASKDAGLYQRQYSRRQTESAAADLTSKGMLINDVAPAERERMRRAVQPAMHKLLAGYDPETVGLFDAELDRIRK